MKYFVYILSSKSASRYYIGYTADISARLAQHNSGVNTSTRPYHPWEIIYQEVFASRAEAWKRERQIKSYKGGSAFKALIESS